MKELTGNEPEDGPKRINYIFILSVDYNRTQSAVYFDGVAARRGGIRLDTHEANGEETVHHWYTMKNGEHELVLCKYEKPVSCHRGRFGLANDEAREHAKRLEENTRLVEVKCQTDEILKLDERLNIERSY